jgi:hypothetical protein
MGNILCGATNNTNNSTNLENIVEPIKEAEVLQNEDPIKAAEVIKEAEVVLQNEEPIKEPVLEEEAVKEYEPIKEAVLEEEPLDESVGSDSSSTTSSVNDTVPLVTIDKVNEEPVKKKRGRKKKVV